jgi:F-type H+-transporting ATPase subunit delta
MITGPIVKRYAKALADTALEAGISEAVAQDLTTLVDLVRGSSEFFSVLKNPAVPTEEKLSIVERIWKTIVPTPCCDQTRRLLQLLIQNHRIHLLIPLQQTYQEILDQRAGIVSATIRSSTTLSTEQGNRLEKKLQDLTGFRIRAQYEKDESLIGGIVVRIGSTVYDGSVRNQLEAVHKMLVRE